MRTPTILLLLMTLLSTGCMSFDPSKRLAEAEAELSSAQDEMDRFDVLGEAALMSLEIGASEKAKVYAKELLELAPKFSDDWNYGNAIHEGNLVLGRLELRAGNIEAAKRHLLESAKINGSPQLNSFGPKMILAKELLEKGEREVVLEYFSLCGKFWELGQEKLKKWTAMVQAGEIPDFGPNLLY